MATVLNPDGSGRENVKIRSFPHAQELVGGLVQVVELGDRVLFVHEEALCLPDPVLNTTATLLAGQPLYGTVIVLSRAEAKRVLG